MAALVFIVLVVVVLIVGNAVFAIAGSLLHLLVPVILWMLAGMFAGRILRGRGYGPVGDVALGLVGGIVGSVLLRVIGLGALANLWLVGSVIAGVFGAVVFVYAVRLVADQNFGR